jgi:hypothetical protein
MSDVKTTPLFPALFPIADTQYGTAQNYLECYDRGIEAHIPSLKESRNRKGIFPDEAFHYDPANDTRLCPGGNSLKRRRYDKRDETFEYQCLARLCKACPVRDQCTTSKGGGTIRSHRRYDEIRQMRERALSRTSERDPRIRQHLMEKSFAQAVRLGFKRARWRLLWRVQIQEYLTAAIQNIMVLVRFEPILRLALLRLYPILPSLSKPTLPSHFLSVCIDLSSFEYQIQIECPLSNSP